MRLASSNFDPRAAFVSLAAHGLALGAIVAVSAGFGPAFQAVDPQPAAYMVVLAPFAPVLAAPVEVPDLTATGPEVLPQASAAQPELPAPSKSVAQAAAPKVSAPKARPSRAAELRAASQIPADTVSAHHSMQEVGDASVAGTRSDVSEAEVPNMASQSAAAPQRDAAFADDAPAATQTAVAEPVVRAARFRVPPSPPIYPRRAIELDLRGTTILRALVDPEGAATEIVVWASSGVRLLDNAAIAAARGWKFEPAREGAIAVAAWVEVPVRFELQ